MEPQYEIKLIPPNLRQEETIVQIAEALNHLKDISHDIFKRFECRISEDTKTVSLLKERIVSTRNKLDKLSQAKKATQVFSSSKYPASNINHQYKSLFSNPQSKLPMKHFDYTYKTGLVKNETLETLQFWHVDVKPSSERQNLKGLGKAPQDLGSVNDLLLFNEGINPYRNFGHVKQKSQTTNHQNADKGKAFDIGAAPLSISDKAALQQSNMEKFFYSPNLGDVPNLEVPLDLPDLPGIADNVRYNIGEHGPGIAPSVSALNLPDLPEIVDDNESPLVEEIVIPPKQEETIPKIVPNVEKVKDPDAVETEILNSNKKEDSGPKIIQNVISAVPPPPPPPPVAPPADRSNLMEAIRNAGGLKMLRQTKHLDEEAPKTPSGNSLMDDLHAKLSMRRKGISGSKLDGSTALDKISAMIPPPSMQAEVSESTEDEDWDE